MKKNSFLLFLLMVINVICFAQVSKELSTKDVIEKLQKDIPVLMKEADIPGMSVALIRDGKLVWSNVFGVTDVTTKKAVTSQTVFEAASLSKCVFAYGVLKLVDEGKLDLDSPLNKYLGNNYDVADTEKRINLITARHVLSHSSGFPNWREHDNTKTLMIHFKPGTQWSYSGEGMVYLSRVVEKITGMTVEEFMQKNVLQPLGMTASSYIWQPRYDSLKAYRHDAFGIKTGRVENGNSGLASIKDGGNVAASLTTNAVDYAKFIIAVLNGTGLKKSTRDEMFAPQIRVTQKYPQLAWGLGVGLETMPEGEYFWHWGDNSDCKAYVTAFIPNKDAIVYFANSANGLSIAKEIIDDGIGGEHPALLNLDYERYNSPSRMLVKSIIANGATQALFQYQIDRKKDTSKTINEQSINGIGYTLMNVKKLDAALEVFKLNTEDYPNSYNAWDSFAEANMNKGNKELAIKYYEKSVQLNPENKNGIEQLKKLKQ